MDGYNCVTSTNYPADYGNHQACTVAINPAAKIDVIAFDTESGFDKVRVHGVAYDGRGSGLEGKVTSELSWSSDGSVTESGWKICFYATCTDVDTPYAGCTVPACTAADTPYAGCTVPACTDVATPYDGCTALPELISFKCDQHVVDVSSSGDVTVTCELCAKDYHGVFIGMHAAFTGTSGYSGIQFSAPTTNMRTFLGDSNGFNIYLYGHDTTVCGSGSFAIPSYRNKFDLGTSTGVYMLGYTSGCEHGSDGTSSDNGRGSCSEELQFELADGYGNVQTYTMGELEANPNVQTSIVVANSHFTLGEAKNRATGDSTPPELVSFKCDQFVVDVSNGEDAYITCEFCAKDDGGFYSDGGHSSTASIVGGRSYNSRGGLSFSAPTPDSESRSFMDGYSTELTFYLDSNGGDSTVCSSDSVAVKAYHSKWDLGQGAGVYTLGYQRGCEVEFHDDSNDDSEHGEYKYDGSTGISLSGSGIVYVSNCYEELQLQLVDGHGNIRKYTMDELEANPNVQTSVVVANSHFTAGQERAAAERTPPELVSINCDHTVVDVSGGDVPITCEICAKDMGGFHSAGQSEPAMQFSAVGPSTELRFYLDSNGGDATVCSSASFSVKGFSNKFDPGTGAGVYTLGSMQEGSGSGSGEDSAVFELVDGHGNVQTYTFDELEANTNVQVTLEVTNSHVIIGQALDTTPPELVSFKCDQSVVDVSGGNVMVNCELCAKDDGGFNGESVAMTFNNPGGTRSALGHVVNNVPGTVLSF
jgi:hypothetical protein